jgi:hypothetical protein
VPFERRLDAGSVEQAEGNVQGFAEASVVVVVDVPCVHDDADLEPAVLFARIREASVVAGHTPAENFQDSVGNYVADPDLWGFCGAR